jgi:hypothetical protein
LIPFAALYTPHPGAQKLSGETAHRAFFPFSALAGLKGRGNFLFAGETSFHFFV